MIIIYANYHKDGHTGAALAAIERSLTERQQSYEVWDLFEADFDVRYNPHTTDQTDDTHRAIDPQIRYWQDRLAEETDIIIIYPTWWINVPAVLKGWYDRVLTAKFAFQYNYKGIPEGLLTGKRAFVVSTGGAPTWLHRFGKGFRSLKVTTSDTLNFCGIKTKTCFIGSCTQITDEKRSVIDATVNHAFRKWL